MSLQHVGSRIQKVFRKYGIWGSIALAAKIPYQRVHSRVIDWNFDRQWGVDTKGRMDPQGRADLMQFAAQYQGTPPGMFKSALRSLPIDAERFSFYDLGCGKGRILLLAAKHPFRTVVGVEFSPELTEIANRNIDRCVSTMKNGFEKISVVLGDAGEYEFPDEPAVIALFNPFDKPVMERVVGNILKLASKRDCYVIYVNPILASLFSNERLFTPLKKAHSYTIWKVNGAAQPAPSEVASHR